MFRTLVLALVFSLSAHAAPRVRAVSQPPSALAITDELATADPLFGFSYQFEQLPRVASGGGIGLVVWNGGAKAARVDASGHLLDATPIAVLPQAFNVISDVVFHDGAFFFGAATYATSTEPLDLVLVRVTPAGEVSTTRIAGTIAANTLSLATNGRELLLAAATREGIDTYRIAANGAVTLGPRLAGDLPKLASDGTSFLALYRTGGVFTVIRIDRDGTAGEPAPLALPNAQDLLWNGTDYVVLGLVTDVLRGVRVSAAGVPGEAFLEVPVDPSTLFPSFSWTGSEYRLVWKQRGPFVGTAATYDVWTARAGANGHVIETVRLRERADTYGRRAAIGSTDIDGSLMVWGEFLEAGSGNIANIVAATGTAVEVVSRRANDQSQSAVAQNGAATLIASVDVRRSATDLGTGRISIVRLNADGTHPPGPGKVLYPSRGFQDFPDAAWNGVDTWIVWRESPGVFAARIDANGTLLDREPIQVATATLNGAPQIACGAADCLVVWAEIASGGPAHVRSMRMAPNGTRLDAQPADYGVGLAEDVVWSGSDYAFAMGTPDGVVLTRLRGGSTLISSGPMFDAAVAWSGSEYLVVWRDESIVRYALAGAAGNLLREPQVLGTGLFASAVWTGRHFLVAWWESPQIRGARITRGGAVVDTFPLSPVGNHGDPVLAIRDDGTIVVSYTRYESQWPYWGAQRNYVRLARD